jgi:thioesterase domain-containing protein
MNAAPEINRNDLDIDTGTSNIAKMREIAFALRWKEAMWRSGKGQVGGPIIPLHVVAMDDGSRIPCYGVNSLNPSSTDFSRLAEMLGPEQPFFSIHPPSQERNAERARSVPDLAKYYVDALIKFQPTGPLVLSGWSVGAVIALEMAQQLKNIHDREVALLVAIDFGPLNTPADKRPFSIFEKCARFYFQISNFAGLVYEEVKRNPSLLPASRGIWNKAKESIARIRERRKEAAGLLQRHPAETRLSFFKHIPRDAQEYAKALHTAVEDYVPKKYSGPVLVYVSTAQPLRLESRVEEKWKDIADSLSVFVVEGTHAAIFEEKDGCPLAKHLRGELDELSLAIPRAATYPGSRIADAPKVGLKQMDPHSLQQGTSAP